MFILFDWVKFSTKLEKYILFKKEKPATAWFWKWLWSRRPFNNLQFEARRSIAEKKMIRIFFTVVWHLPCPISQETFTVFQALLTIMLVNASASANKLGIFGNQKIRNKLFSAGSLTFSTFLAGAVIYLARQRTCLSKVHLMILGHNFSHIKLCCPLVWWGVCTRISYPNFLDKTHWYLFTPKCLMRIYKLNDRKPPKLLRELLRY